MSLSDHLRYLRALQGGTDFETIAEAIDLDNPAHIAGAERQYRPLKDESLIEKLAGYYDRPVEEFHWHNARSRKALTFYLEKARWEQTAVSLTLRGGEKVAGIVEWWDLASIGLRVEDSRLLVVQRHAVVDWP